jgi:YD repeat-containing protein
MSISRTEDYLLVARRLGRKRSDWWRLLPYALAFVAAVCSAATTQYQYDALGRLREVTHANGNITTYTLDAAGNRLRVDELSAAAPPAWIDVPPVSYTGSYSVRWGAGGTVSTYELWESTSSNFATQTRVFLGEGLIASISGHGSGTYYYRVRGCNGSACTSYRVGQNPTVVGPLVIPAVPALISVPTSGNGSYPLSWAAVSGPVTHYHVQECGTADFSTSIWNVYNAMGTGFTLSNITNGTFYYRVRACNDAGCSAFKYAPNGINNVVAPGAPSITAPTTNSNGNVNIIWDAPTGVVTKYDLYISTSASFATQTLVLTGTASNVTDFGRPSGTWYYRVQACNQNQCGPYGTAGNSTVVNNPYPPKPTGLTTNPNAQCGWTAQWNASAGASHYSFRDQSGTFASSPTGTSTTYSYCNDPNNQQLYKPKWVKACNAVGCSIQADFP